MNILMIGNGFDLAHGLPTKYGDFLLFAKMIQIVIEKIGIKKIIPTNDKEFKNWTDDIESLKCGNLDLLFSNLIPNEVSDKEKHKFEGIKDYVIDLFVQGDMIIRKKVVYYVHNNFWIEYFIQCPMYQKENWIDFESEIKDVIESFNNDIRYSISEVKINDVAVRNKISNDFLRDYFIVDTDKLIEEQNMIIYEEVKEKELNAQEYSNYIDKYREENPIENSASISYKAIIEQIEHDLNRVILALEIYLYDYVENIEIKQKSPDISDIITGLSQNDILKIISFNYTHTCEKLYQKKMIIKGDKTNYDYLHGETLKTENNMVLGIDEYLTPDKENKDVEFIAFKKFFQRIFKGTGCRYRDWVDIILSRREKEKGIRQQKNINENEHIPFNYFTNDYRHMLYIFGHSLDMTDKDVLKDLILNDNVKTTIFYLDSDDLKSKIANLVKVIHQDELIRRTGGSTKTIEFKLQQDMVDRK